MNKKHFHPVPPPTPSPELAPCRAAIRTENGKINVYIALRDTMENAVLVASFAEQFNVDHEEALKPFIMQYAQQAVAAFMKTATGIEVTHTVYQPPKD